MTHSSNICRGSELSAQTSKRLSSGVAELDGLLDGGLKFGEISEWGVPQGYSGRHVVLNFLATLFQQSDSQKFLILWVFPDNHEAIYAPAWRAKGISLENIYFVSCSEPLTKLKAAFLEPLFSCIVIDRPRQLRRDDLSFIAACARDHRYSVFLLRDYFLTHDKPNIWAKIRLNCWLDFDANQFFVQLMRGGTPRQVAFTLQEDLWL